MIIRNPKHWLLAGTGAYDGMQLPGLVGAEYDRVNLSVPTPRPIEVLARSPLICNGVASHSDMAYYTTPSGAGVLSTGTNWWIQAIGGSKGTESAPLHRRCHEEHADGSSPRAPLDASTRPRQPCRARHGRLVRRADRSHGAQLTLIHARAHAGLRRRS